MQLQRPMFDDRSTFDSGYRIVSRVSETNRLSMNVCTLCARVIPLDRRCLMSRSSTHTAFETRCVCVWIWRVI